ncbi:MAG TPA: hypothetical protein VFX44_11930 [Solirubrobacterales bacterium]|nr:hypothetical protein [Solirubrobacterales bacterium]
MGRRKTPARLRTEILARLEEFDYQLLLLEEAMKEFGEDFDLREFKRAFEKESGVVGSHKVQAVERSFSHVQNFMAQLAEAGGMLARLEPPKIHEGPAARAFEALEAAEVIDAPLCDRLKRCWQARSELEHDYIHVTAGRVHEAAKLAAESAPDFIERYKRWIEPYLG